MWFTGIPSIQIKINLMRDFMGQNDGFHIARKMREKFTRQLYNAILRNVAASTFCIPIIDDNPRRIQANQFRETFAVFRPILVSEFIKGFLQHRLDYSGKFAQVIRVWHLK